MHYYKILKHKAGFGEGTNYWEKLLARYLAATGGGKIHTTLPITFTSTSWKLASWTIYGNNDVGKNLLEITATSEETALNGIKFTVDKENGIIIANGRATAQRAFNVGIVTNDTSGTIDYYLSGGADGGAETSYFLIGMNGNIRLKKWDGTRDMNGSSSLEDIQQMQIPAGVTGTMRIYIRNGTVCENLVFKPMVRLPDTSLDFEPYQIGVGRQTKNLINPDETTQGDGYVADCILTGTGTVSVAWAYITEYIPVEAGMSYCIFRNLYRASNSTTNKRSMVAFYDANKAQISYDEISWHFSQVNYNVTNCDVFSTPENCKYVRTTIDRNSTLNMLIKSSVPPSDFIPYGYEVSLTISQTGQIDKNYDIYIGTAPLTEGQTVSNTTEIEVFEGENTIDTTLYNKPEMEIIYE